MEISSFLQRLPGGKALNSAKDALIAQGAKARFNHLLRKYGTMLDLKLNTAERSLSVSLHLKGEESPININVREYTLVTKVEARLRLHANGSRHSSRIAWAGGALQYQTIWPDSFRS